MLFRSLDWFLWSIFRGLYDWRHTITDRVTGSQTFLNLRRALHRATQAHPCFLDLVRERLRISCFSGLPLTLVIVAGLYIASLFGGLIKELYEAGEVVWLDDALNSALEPWRDRPILDASLWVTTFASSPAMLAVVIVATGFMWLGPWKTDLPALWVAFLGSQFTIWSAKVLIGRVRPDPLELVSSFGPAFPSGHAATSLTVYGFLAYVMTRRPAKARQRDRKSVV